MYGVRKTCRLSGQIIGCSLNSRMNTYDKVMKECLAEMVMRGGT